MVFAMMLPEMPPEETLQTGRVEPCLGLLELAQGRREIREITALFGVEAPAPTISRERETIAPTRRVFRVNARMVKRHREQVVLIPGEVVSAQRYADHILTHSQLGDGPGRRAAPDRSQTTRFREPAACGYRQISIRSKPYEGTSVRVDVPLHLAKEESEEAK